VALDLAEHYTFRRMRHYSGGVRLHKHPDYDRGTVIAWIVATQLSNVPSISHKQTLDSLLGSGIMVL